MKLASPRFALQVIAILGLIGSFLWLITQPSFEPTLAFLAALATLITSFFVSDEPIDSVRDLLPSFNSNNRKKFLHKIRLIWVKGVLEPSLQESGYIPLQIQDVSQLVTTPLESFKGEFENILDAYNAFGEELLILGQPASGKTTLLLTLANQMISKAEKDDSAPMPVILNMASWGQKAISIEDWIIEEVRTKYKLSKAIITPWLRNNQLMFLLDGLDEVDQALLPKCILALNSFKMDFGLTGLVICSRSNDYQQAKIKLNLAGAVEIQPLTKLQISNVLKQSGWRKKEMEIASNFHEELLQSPLFLSIFVSLDLIKKNLSEVNLIEQRKALFNAYISKVLSPLKKNKNFFSQDEILHWLQWLAGELKTQNETIFFIENLQPISLKKTSEIWQYALFSRLISGIFLGMILSLVVSIFAYIVALDNKAGFAELISFGLCLGLMISFINALSWIGRATVFWRVIGTYSYSIFIGATSSILFFAFMAWVSNEVKSVETAVISLGFGVTTIFISKQVFRSDFIQNHVDIEPVEKLVWTWKAVWKGILKGLISSLVVGFIFGVFFSAYYDLVIISLIIELIAGIFIVGGLIGGLVTGIIALLVYLIKHKNISFFYQTITASSYRTSVELGVLAGFVITLSFYITKFLQSDTFIELTGIISRLIPKNTEDFQTSPPALPIELATYLFILLMICGGIILLSFLFISFRSNNNVNMEKNYLHKRNPIFLKIKKFLATLCSSFVYTFSLLMFLTGLWSAFSINALLFLDFPTITMACCLVGGIIGGFGHQSIEEKVVPNQGIHASFQNALVITLLSVFVFTLITTLLLDFGGMGLAILSIVLSISDVFSFIPFPQNGSQNSVHATPLPSLLFGLILGILLGMRYGGYATIQHLVLRLILFRQKYITWRIEKYLEYLVSCTLLRKVGGGYIFTHYLLREHLLSLDTREMADVLKEI